MNYEKKGEQKPAEWSGDSAKIINDCISAIHAADYYSLEDKERMESFLKSLRPQPKQECDAWIERIIDILDWAEEKGRISYSDFIDYSIILKSKFIRLQNRWKPTDKQMLTLAHAIGENSMTDFGKTLESLYDELRILKDY